MQSQPLLLDLKFLGQKLSHLQRAFQVPPAGGEQLTLERGQVTYLRPHGYLHGCMEWPLPSS